MSAVMLGDIKCDKSSLWTIMVEDVVFPYALFRSQRGVDVVM